MTPNAVQRAMNPEPIAPIVRRVLHQIAHAFPQTLMEQPDGSWKRLIVKHVDGCGDCEEVGRIG